MESISRLFIDDPLDPIDDWEQDLAACYAQYRQDTADKSELELHTYLQEKASRSREDYVRLIGGLFYGAVTEPEAIRQHFQFITVVNRDQYVCVKDRLYALVKTVKFALLQRHVLTNMLWMFNELTLMNVANMDGLYVWLLRQIRGGADIGANNLFLADQVLRLLEQHRRWLDNAPRLLATAVYLYLRLIPEHRSITATPLQQKEIRFVVTMLREKWTACSVIGRDLVRALQDVYHLPDFQHVWNDLVHRPQQFAPNFPGIHALLKTPTHKDFLKSRLTPDMEHKLMFILQELRFNSYQRNLNWFMQRFCSHGDGEGFLVDIIRYIVAGWYPNNQLLQSDVVPRYVIIGSLLRTIKSAVVSANVKLAMTLDWLFFEPNDNLMLIEPAMLLMERSVERYPHITSTMLEFLYHASNEYYVPMRNDIKRSLICGMQIMLKMMVIRSLAPIYQCPSLEPPVRKMIKVLFGECLQLPPTEDDDAATKSATTPASAAKTAPASVPADDAPAAPPMDAPMEEEPVAAAVDDDLEPGEAIDDVVMQDATTTTIPAAVEDVVPVVAAIETPLTLTTAPVVVEQPVVAPMDPLDADDSDYSDVDDGAMDVDGTADEGMQSSQSYWIFGDAIERFQAACKLLIASAANDPDEASVQLIITKRSLKEILAVYLRMTIAPETLTSSLGSWIVKVGTRLLLAHSHVDYGKVMVSEDALIMDGVTDPLDEIFWLYWTHKDDAANREKMVQLLSALARRCKHGKKHLVGMRWWAFIAGQLAAHPQSSDRWAETIATSYQEIMIPSDAQAEEMDDADALPRALFKDLKMLSNYNLEAFALVVPFVYRYLASASVGRVDLLRLVARMALPPDVALLGVALQAGTTRVFGRHADHRVLGTAMAQMDHYELATAWHLLDAELQAHAALYDHWRANGIDDLLDGKGAEVLAMLLTALSHVHASAALVQSLLRFCARSQPPLVVAVVLKAWHMRDARETAVALKNHATNAIRDVQQTVLDTDGAAETLAILLIDTLQQWWQTADDNLDVYLQDAELMAVLAQLAGKVDRTWPTDWAATSQTATPVEKVQHEDDDDEGDDDTPAQRARRRAKKVIPLSDDDE